MSPSQRQHADPITRKSVRSALRAWHHTTGLGEHPLAHLRTVHRKRREAGYQDTPAGRGVALRGVLRDAMEALRPDQGQPQYGEKRWRAYIIITQQYLKGHSPAYVCDRLGIARNTYNHEQARALDRLVSILREREQASTPVPRPTSGIPTIEPFLGRQQELDHYRTQLEDLHVAIICGMTGAGKTVLGARLATEDVEHGEVLWITFRKGINADIDSVFRELAAHMAQAGNEKFLAFLQSEAEAGQRYPLHTTIQHLIGALREGTYTLCFDNYQLVNKDRDVTALLDILKDRAMHGGLVNLLVMSQERPAFAAGLSTRPLAGMSQDDAHALLCQLGLSRIPANLFAQVYSATAGYPLFLDLFSRWVIENDLARFSLPEEVARVQGFISEMARAEEVEAYLLANLENSLAPQEQRMLMLMSAFRLPFTDADESAMEIFVKEGIEQPSTVLRNLMRRNIVSRSTDVARVYFTHSLLREYFYNRLRSDLRLKRRVHRWVANYYQTVEGDWVEAAHHHAAAADYEECIRVLNARRELLIGSGETPRMMDILTSIKEHQVPPHVWAVGTAIQGEALAFLGHYDQALERFEKALASFRSQALDDDTRRRAADIARRTGRLQGWRGEYARAHAHMQEALRVLGEPSTRDDRAVAALIRTHIGSLYYLQGALDKAEEECQQAITLLADIPEGGVHAETYKVLGVVYDVTGRWEQAVTFARRSLAIWERLDNQRRIAELRDNLGTLYFYQGEFHEARRLYEQSLRFWKRVGSRDNVGYARLNLGSIHLIQGRLSEASKLYNQALVAWQQTGNHKLTALSQNNLGLLELARGDHARAWEYFQQSVDADPNAENLRGLAEAELGRDNLSLALQHANRSLALAREAGMAFEEGVTLRVLGCVHQALGNTAQAREQLEKSLAILKRLGARYEVGRTLRRLASLEASVGEAEASQAHLGEARAIFERVGASADLEQ